MQGTFNLVHFLCVLTVLGLAAVIVLPRLRQPDRAARYPVADTPVTAPANTDLSR